MAVTSWIRRQFSNAVSTAATLNGSLGSGITTTFSVGSGQGTTFPNGSVGPFIVTIAQGTATEEKILVTSRSGDTFTIAASGRGYNGTTAQNQPSGATVYHTVDAQDFDEANQVANQTLGAIAAKGDLLVGSAANTLAKLAIGSANQFPQVQSGTLGYVGFGSGGTTAIAAAGADGTSTNPARYDHTHSGVTTVNSLAGAVTVGAGNGSGISLINGTQLLLTFTSPNYSVPRLTCFTVGCTKIVTSNETGGQVQLTYTLNSTVQTVTLFAGAQASGTYTQTALITGVCDNNTAIAINQTSALTGGASKVYSAILAA